MKNKEKQWLKNSLLQVILAIYQFRYYRLVLLNDWYCAWKRLGILRTRLGWLVVLGPR